MTEGSGKSPGSTGFAYVAPRCASAEGVKAERQSTSSATLINHARVGTTLVGVAFIGNALVNLALVHVEKFSVITHLTLSLFLLAPLRFAAAARPSAPCFESAPRRACSASCARAAAV